LLTKINIKHIKHNVMEKYLIIIGSIIIFIGILFIVGSKLGIPFGKLPGDISIKKEKFIFHFPIITSIVISIILTAVINLIVWFFKK